MSKGLYDAAVDVAGGNILTNIIASMKYNGTITACGNVAGPKFETTVFPFILRGNRLIGIDSATCSIPLREKIWNNFSTKWQLKNLDNICKIVDLNHLNNEIEKILSGKQIGRVIVKNKLIDISMLDLLHTIDYSILFWIHTNLSSVALDISMPFITDEQNWRIPITLLIFVLGFKTGTKGSYVSEY